MDDKSAAIELVGRPLEPLLGPMISADETFPFARAYISPRTNLHGRSSWAICRLLWIKLRSENAGVKQTGPNFRAPRPGLGTERPWFLSTSKSQQGYSHWNLTQPTKPTLLLSRTSSSSKST